MLGQPMMGTREKVDGAGGPAHKLAAKAPPAPRPAKAPVPRSAKAPSAPKPASAPPAPKPTKAPPAPKPAKVLPKPTKGTVHSPEVLLEHDSQSMKSHTMSCKAKSILSLSASETLVQVGGK